MATVFIDKRMLQCGLFLGLFLGTGRSRSRRKTHRRSACARHAGHPSAVAPRRNNRSCAARGRRRTSAPAGGGPGARAAKAGNLRATPRFLYLPDAPDPVRRAAAAALWSALDPAAEDAQREAKRGAKDMEAALAALREQAAQNRRPLLEMRSRIGAGPRQPLRQSAGLCPGALLFLALICMFLLWRLARRASAPAWWGDAPPRPATRAGRGPHGGLLDDEMDLDAEPSEVRGGQHRPQDLRADPFAPLESARRRRRPRQRAPRAAAASGPTGRRRAGAAGQHRRAVRRPAAIRLLPVAGPTSTRPSRCCASTSRPTPARARWPISTCCASITPSTARKTTAAWPRNSNAPSTPTCRPSRFTQAGKGLEHYRSALARIEALWPAPGTLALIEELVFRKPGGHDDGAFDLAAYQELLLLYSVAKEVIDPASASPAAFEPNAFADTIAREGPPTATSPMEIERPPAAMQDGPVLPPSIYGSIDQGMQHETVMDPDAQLPAARPVTATPPVLRPTPAPAPRPDLDMDLGAFDKTAYETHADADRTGEAADALERSARDRFRPVRSEHRSGNRAASHQALNAAARRCARSTVTLSPIASSTVARPTQFIQALASWAISQPPAAAPTAWPM